MIIDVSTRLGHQRRAVLRRRGFTLVELLICIGLILMLIAIILPALRRSVEAGRQVSCLDHLRQIANATMQYCMDNDGTFPSTAATDNPHGLIPGGPIDANQAQLSDWIYWRRSPATLPPQCTDITRSALARYLGRTNVMTVFRCPSDSADSRLPDSWSSEPYLYSYSMNGWIGETNTLSLHAYGRWLRMHDIVNPSQIILFVDEDQKTIDDGCWLPTNLSDQNSHNQISIRHDVNHDNVESLGEAGFDQAGRGNVAFCDGHGEFVSRQFSLEAVGSQIYNGQKVPYRDHYQPTNRPLPPDVPY